jgi:hypothetical protein
MPNMKTVGQRNLKLLGGQGKTDGQPERTEGRTDNLIPVYPPYNFVVRGYKNNFWPTDHKLEIIDLVNLKK